VTLIKAIVYRFFRVLILFIISYVLLGKLDLALSISVVDMTIATFYYYYFEKIWNKVDNMYLISKG